MDSKAAQDCTLKAWYSHSNAPRISTHTVIAASLKKQHPNLTLSITPQYGTNLFGFAAAGFASYVQIDDQGGDLPGSLEELGYIPPARRIDTSPGLLARSPIFGKFLFKWQGTEYLVYIIETAAAGDAFSLGSNFYILSTKEELNSSFLMAVGKWSNELHDEIWVFDGGYWSKNAELYRSVMKSSWDAVILDPGMKKALIEDHISFFKSKKTYTDLKVPWKRGIIYYGPPGNGKTISIKATMKMLYDLEEPVPTLYVRTLASYGGPEYSVKEIFNMARRYAPCYLVFEDLDSIVTDEVRSYFLNEVDGLQSNDGVFMIGSTNHLDRLDPGIAKRPSRFDRKYFFPNPNFKERTAYCHFWQSKLSDNDDIEFPDQLCEAIAGITDRFSFAYIQEAFVAALLAIARDAEATGTGHQVSKDHISNDWVDLSSISKPEEGSDLKDLPLWIEIQKQVKILREGLESEE